MSEENEDQQALDSETLLRLSQLTRKQLVEELTAEGLPTDKDSINNLLQTLRDMDATSIQRKKLDVDEQNADTNQQAQLLLERIYQSNTPILRQDEPTDQKQVNPDPSQLPESEPIEGEMETGIRQEDPKAFYQRLEGADKDEN